MEDGVTENEKQVLIAIDEDQEKEAAKEVVDVEEKPVGFIDQLISSFTPGDKETVMNNKISHEEATGDKQERNNGGGGGGDVEEEKPIGLINQIISSFAPQDDNKQTKEQASVDSIEEKQEEDKEGGGILSHIIFNLVSSPASSPRGQADKAAHHLFDEAKKGQKDGNGIVDNIVSHLPTPLPDDAAPASDEASILIHSIIHD